MISGWNLALALLLTGTADAVPLAADPAVAEVATTVAQLRQTPPVTTPFVEYRFTRFTKRPLRSSGTLHFFGPDHLERVLVAPRAETSTIRDGRVRVSRAGKVVRDLSLTTVPELQALMQGFTGVLQGDHAVLMEFFTTTLASDPTGFVLTLVPKSPSMAKRLARIDVIGRAAKAECMVFVDTDGDQAVLLLRADPGWAQDGSPITVDRLISTCRVP